MAINKPNTYIRYIDIQSKMKYYSVAHKSLKTVWLLFALYILLLIITSFLWLNNFLQVERCKKHLHSEPLINDLLKTRRNITKINDLIGTVVIYMFLLKEIITVVLCSLSIITLVKILRKENINKTTRVMDITENVINLSIGIILIKSLFIVRTEGFPANENIFDLDCQKLINFEFPMLSYIIFCIIRLLIELTFNIVYKSFNIEIEIEDSNEITVNQ